MSLLIYVPGSHGRERSVRLLDALGLGTLYDEGVEAAFSDVLDNGPDGGGGMLVGLDCPVVLYDAERQEWRKCSREGELESGRAWLGWFRDQRPTPQALARKRQHAGEWLKLADGNEWLVPCAKQLPHVVDLNEQGAVVPRLSERYRKFFDQSFAMLQKFIEAPQGQAAMPWGEALAYAVEALALNYRLTRDVVVGLGLLETDMLWTIPETVTEFRKIVDTVLKKNKPSASSSTDSGGSD